MQDRREESPWLSPAPYSLLYHRSKSVDAQECLARGKAGRWVGAASRQLYTVLGSGLDLTSPTPCAPMTQRVSEWRAGGTSSHPDGCSVSSAPGLCWHWVPGSWWGLQAGAHRAHPPPIHIHTSHLRPFPQPHPSAQGPSWTP